MKYNLVARAAVQDTKISGRGRLSIGKVVTFLEKK
jgi:hypothetical protein